MKLLSMEFTSEHIFLYVIQTRNRQIMVEKKVVLDMPDNAYYNGAIINNDRGVSDRIRECLLEKKIDVKKTICTVSSMDCMQEEFSVLNGNEKQIDGMVEQELIKRRKLGNDYIYEYKILGEDMLNPGFIKVQVYICPKVMIQNYYDVLKKAGLQPYRFEIVSRVMDDISKKAGFQDRADKSILACISKDEAHFMYVGCQETPYYRYARLKKENVIEENIYVLSNLTAAYSREENQETVSAVIENLTRLARFHAQRYRDKEMKAVYLYGSYEDIHALADGIEAGAGISVIPLDYRSVADDIQYHKQDTGYSYNALAAAVKVLEDKKEKRNFFEKYEESLKSKTDIRMFLPSIVGLVLTVLILMGAAAVGYQNILTKKQIEETKIKISSPDILERYAKNQKLLEQINQYHVYNETCEQYIAALEDMPRLGREHFEKVDVLKPINVEIMGYGYDNGKLSISCTASDQHAPADYAEILTNAGFYKVDYSGFSKSTRVDGSIQYNFYVYVYLWE